MYLLSLSLMLFLSNTASLYGASAEEGTEENSILIEYVLPEKHAQTKSLNSKNVWNSKKFGRHFKQAATRRFIRTIKRNQALINRNDIYTRVWQICLINYLKNLTILYEFQPTGNTAELSLMDLLDSRRKPLTLKIKPYSLELSKAGRVVSVHIQNTSNTPPDNGAFS